MIVYHGSLEIVRNPDISHSLRNLDFGKGFYVTSVREQAEKWAARKADLLNQSHGIVNVYHFRDPDETYRVKEFADDLYEWINFVCACRDGSLIYQDYDIIKGKVADDKVFRVVNFYHLGIWEKDRAIREMKAYETYDQYAFITQNTIDHLLTFESSYEVPYD